MFIRLSILLLLSRPFGSIRRVQKICCQKRYIKQLYLTPISRDSNYNLEQPKKKGFLQSISNSHYTFLFLSYSFGIEAIKTFFHTPSSLENHTRFETKNSKVYTRFQTKMAQEPYPLARHIPIWLIWGSAPPFLGQRHASLIFIHLFCKFYSLNLNLQTKMINKWCTKN